MTDEDDKMPEMNMSLSYSTDGQSGNLTIYLYNIPTRQLESIEANMKKRFDCARRDFMNLKNLEKARKKAPKQEAEE